MSSGGATSVVTMKATAAAFPQSNSQAQKQHSQNNLQPTNHNPSQHSQLHRLSQPHLSASIHPVQSIAQNVVAASGHSTHPSVFPNAEFFQTLQQTAAAAALPTVLPYDQSQYIGQLMYFPYPTAAAAAANGLFNTGQSNDTATHHMSIGSSTPGGSVSGNQATIINQASCHATAGQLLTGGLVSATPSGMMTLNNATGSNQVNNANHLFASGAGLVGIGGSGVGGASGSNTVSVSNSASLAPLFTTAHFYPHHHTQQTGQQQPQQQFQIHHSLQQPHHPHTSVHMQHVQTLTAEDKLQSTTPVHTPQKQSDQELLSQSTQLGTPSQGNNSSLDASSTTVKRDNNGTGHFVCGVCGREFGMRCRLIAHTRRHTGERPFPCADCGRAFSDRGNLQRHRYTHSSQPRFHCTVCGKSFPGAAAAAIGGPVPLDRKGRPCNYPCPACPRRFAFQCRLAAHLRCHTNIRPFICIDCGRAFTQRGYLVRHAAVHKLDRPFSCGLCDRSYKHYGSLVNHRRTHSKSSGNTTNLSNLNLLSNLGTITSTNIGTLSSLEEVVSGALGQSHKTDSTSDAMNNQSTTTITLLPVSKVEEILPGDLNSSIQQVCLSSGSNILTVSEGQEQQQHNSEQVTSHQLTATAVWPILATGGGGGSVGINHVSQAQLIPSSIVQQQSRQAMVSGSHFSTITISPTQLAQSNQPSSSSSQQQQQLPLVTAPRPPHLSQPTSTTMLSTANVIAGNGGTSAPTFVTLPLFNGSIQNNLTESDRSIINGQLTPHSHHQFHCPISTLSDSSQPQQHHLQIAQTTATLQQQHIQANNSTTRVSGVDTNNNNTAPVLHVLQPSPSIFFSPYYLPHSAASQM
ncbi:putative zinc finger protein [Schistosoma mansoni]|uniref:putative zinc finger protein n=1 Tax=Schistosoma mansoni TaxID=6183 RepID=UPI00022DC5B5|nr:putative zinc finger protein [Schistosoma mansoni]|eukprot:XP_018653443.1 putative zinc finger protein [Schistosoma mansoni]